MSQQKKTQFPRSHDQLLFDIPQISVSIKFGRLPTLTGREDYRTCAESLEITFDSMDLLEILKKDAPLNLSKNSADYKIWNLGYKKLRGALPEAIDESLRTTIMNDQTAKVSWEYLKSRFGRETSSSIISLLKDILSFSLKVGDSIPEFLTIFYDAWNLLRNRSLLKYSFA